MAGGDKTTPGSMWPSLPSGQRPQLCRAFWECSAPDRFTDAFLGSSHFLLCNFFSERPGVHSGCYRGVPLCSLTHPQLSSTEGQSVPHSPGSRHLPQPSLRKPWARHLRQVSWVPSQASLHQQVQQRAFQNRGACSPRSGRVLFQSGFGARSGGGGRHQGVRGCSEPQLVTHSGDDSLPKQGRF